MLEQDAHAPSPGGRDWLAALLLRRQSRLMPRFTAALVRLRAAPRAARRRLQRRAAVSLAGAALLVAMTASPLLIPSAHAATITVANGAIAVNAGDAQCSLIEAINNANSDSDTSGGDCVAGAGADTITLPAGGSFNFAGSYHYDQGDNGLPSITSVITIQGNGSTLDLGGSAVGIRLAVVQSTGNLTVVDTTITDGHMYNTFYYPGGILLVDGGTLTIEGSTLQDSATNSEGGAIVIDDGTLTITDSTLSGNISNYGGALSADHSTTVIENSTISGNYADFLGGGVAAYDGTLTIRGSIINDNGWQVGNIGVVGDTTYGGGVVVGNAGLNITTTTIDGNFSRFGGGGVLIAESTGVVIDQSAITNNVTDSAGGGVSWGVYTEGGPQSAEGTITNTTISGNSAGDGGGVAVVMGALTVNNVTISDNTAEYYGGGLVAFGTATLNRTIISGNSAASGAEIFKYEGEYGGGTITANNFNLFGHSGLTNAQAFENFTPGATDITATSNGTQPTALAAILDPLDDNGGPTTPATETHALVLGSPARDGAPSAACTPAPVGGVDQRDAPRNVDGDGAASANECDVGAYEAPLVAPPSICPAPGNEVTTILGVGMGSPKKASLSKKLVVPNSTDLVALYGQLAGKDVGKDPRFVRFTYPGGGGSVQVNTMTGTSQRNGGVYWYGTNLAPASSITGRWFLAPKTKGKVPRALILYATYETTATYFDTYVLYNNGATNTVGPEEPWATQQLLTIPIDPPLAPADVTVQVALVDNDKDPRFVTVNASAGPVMEGNTSNNPTHGDTLSILTFTLEDVPAGTDEVTLELLSGVNGDSAAIVGAAANYECNPN